MSNFDASWRTFIPTTRTPGANKYGARKKQASDGTLCASTKEANRYNDLLMMQMAGAISRLEAHPSFDLIINGMYIGRYTADSRYVTDQGEVIIEDCKGGTATKTEAYSLRKRVFEAIYWPLIVREV